MVKYYYQNPSYLISTVFGLPETDGIEKISFSHLRYNLVYYFKQDKTQYVNQIATRINAGYRVYGNVLVLHEMEENLYTNVSVHEMKRLNVLSYGRLYDRDLKEEENHTLTKVEPDENGNDVEKKIVPFWSRYIVIEHRMVEWHNKKNKCINCGQDMKTPIVCQSCYRLKYCSKNCENEFHHYHYDECIKQK
jgi:hypothetical protein